MAPTKLIAGTIVLFMVLAMAEAQVETCSSALADDLKNTCADAATNASVAPSPACCSVVGSASTSCLCNALNQWGSDKVNMDASLAIPRACAVPVKAGSTCDGLVIPEFPVIGAHLATLIASTHTTHGVPPSPTPTPCGG